MISDNELKKMEATSKRVIDEIDVNIVKVKMVIYIKQADLKGHFKKYKTEQAPDPNWDKLF